MAFAAAFLTAGLSVTTAGFVGVVFAGLEVADADLSVPFSCRSGTLVRDSVVAAFMPEPATAERSAVLGCAGAGFDDVDAFLTVVDFDVGFLEVVDFDVVDFTVVDFVVLGFFAAGDFFVPAAFGAVGEGGALGVASALAPDSGFAMAEAAESDAATACFFAAADPGCLFALVGAFFGVDAFFGLGEELAFRAPDVALDEAEPSTPSTVVRFAAAPVCFFPAAAGGFCAAEPAAFFAGVFFAGAFFVAGFFAPAGGGAVTALLATADGVSRAAASEACAD